MFNSREHLRIGGGEGEGDSKKERGKWLEKKKKRNSRMGS